MTIQDEPEEGGPQLGELSENAAVDLAQFYDPREKRTLNLLGVALRDSRKFDLRFLDSAQARHLGPGLILALEHLGGTPRVLELPASPPFALRLGHTAIPHPFLVELAQAWDFGFGFPLLLETGRKCPLERIFHQVIRDFMPGRKPESQERRNRALSSWLERKAEARLARKKQRGLRS